MTSREKKRFELDMLRGLLRRMSIPVEILADTCESPDLVILVEGRRIGVEVTEIQKSRDDRAKRAPKDDILERAKAVYEMRRATPISLICSFIEYEDLRSADRRALSRELSEFLLALDSRDDFKAVIIDREHLPPALGRVIREIRYWREPERGIWQCIEASWVARLTRDVLQERVDAKRGLLPRYLGNGIDACWLLICAHPTNPACRFQAGRDFVPSHVDSPFERTFFFDGWQAFELGRIDPSDNIACPPPPIAAPMVD